MIAADVTTYSATTSAGGRDLLWQRAQELIEEMRSQGMPAVVITRNATISACENGEQWQRASRRCARRN